MTFRAVASVVRLHNLLGVALVATTSVVWLGQEQFIAGRAIAYALGCCLLAAAGYAFNDLRDVRFDRIAHPSRPLVTEALRPTAVRWISAIASLSGVLVLVSVDPVYLFFAPFTALLLVVYSLGLKNRFGFLGNLLTAALVAAVPLLAGISAKNVPAIAPLALVGFGLTLSREILKDIQDCPADSANGRRTLATTGHLPAARVLVVVSVFTAVVAAWFQIDRPVAAGFSDLVVAVLGALSVAASILWLTSPGRLRFTQQALKVAMFGYALLFLVLAVLR